MQYFRTDKKTLSGSQSIVNQCSTVITCKWGESRFFALFSENIDLEFICKNKFLVSHCIGQTEQRRLL